MLDRVARTYGNEFADETTGPGVIARTLAAIGRRPGRTAAIVVLGVGAIAIVSNAAFFQTAEHPSPLFATRPATEQVADTPAPTAVAAPPVAPRIDEVGRLVELTAVAPPPARAIPASPNVVEVQQLLTAQGYEPGTVDGLYGTRTQTAIEAYQRDRGLTVTGTVDEALVAQLRQTAAAPAAAEGTPAAPVANANAGRPSESATILAVQTALNQTGYGPVAADGTVNTATADAIRRFQLEQGLDLTGRVDDALIARMTAIGALE